MAAQYIIEVSVTANFNIHWHTVARISECTLTTSSLTDTVPGRFRVLHEIMCLAHYNAVFANVHLPVDTSKFAPVTGPSGCTYLHV